MARRKNGSLVHQTMKRLEELDRRGTSKHIAKEQHKQFCEKHGYKYNPAKAPGVYSNATYDTYKKEMVAFVKDLKEREPSIRRLEDIKQEHVHSYLQSQQEHKSAYSVRTSMSAINKCLGMQVTQKSAGLKERSYKNITRSRDIDKKPYLKEINLDNYKKEIQILQAFGIRRECVAGGQYSIKPCSLFKNTEDNRIYVNIISKNGKFNSVPCLRSMQQKIEETYPNIQEREPYYRSEEERQVGKLNYIIEYQNSNDDRLFSKLPSRIPSHKLRAEYGANLYKEELEQKQTPYEDYRGFDKDTVKFVSQSLSHGRLAVFVENYAYLLKQE